jgi:hypothetical protein
MKHPVRRVVPLILPKEQYRDRFGEPAAFVDMNPSMYIRRDGQVIVLVRRVNYRKYADKQFSLGSYPSESKYMSARGNMDDLTHWNIEPLRIDYGLATYPTYWKGPEDIRFISETRLIATIPECNPSGNPAIFQAVLDGSVLKSFEPCYPNETEKNWMPFMDEKGRLRVVYSVSPFRIKDIKENTVETLGVHLPELEGYHGSTNGIPYMDIYRLFLIHINRERSYNRWLLFHPGKKTVQFSNEFTFFQYSYIEFPVSLSTYKGSLYVSIGVNDEAAYILEVDAPVFPENLMETVRV